jgi:hypothetical protein
MLFYVSVKLGLSLRKAEDVRGWGIHEDFSAYEGRSKGNGKNGTTKASLHVVFGKNDWGDQIQDDDVGRACGTCGGLVGKTEGKRPLLKPRCR